MAYMYSKKVMELFRHPHNMGEIRHADAIGKVGNPMCGDLMWVYVKFGKDRKGEEIIKDIKVKTFGCVAAMATSSLTTDLAKGKSIEEALKITNRKVVKGAGGLPAVKIHCSVLAVDGLREAIYGYLKRKGRPIPRVVLEAHKRVEKELREVEHMRKSMLK
jgi:nitrogen fixation NifU-like protein